MVIIMNRIVEYINTLSEHDQSKLIKTIISNSHNYVPGMEDIKVSLDGDNTPTRDRAYMVYVHKMEHPKINISKLCFDFGISETYYRAERAKHIIEWDNHYNTSVKRDMLIFAFDYAQDKNMVDWERLYNQVPIELFFIPESFSVEPTPQQHTLVN